jgi:endogenous inhibitor of DNA gyrase (YacG/DUF329 family)
MPKVVQCPRCGKPILWDESHPWRPFCSERCRLIDLGNWATEKYRIKAEDQRDPEADKNDEAP